MNRILILSLIAAAACGGTDSSNNNNPAKPALGATQVDRMGRAAVNTALTNPFGLVTGQTSNQTKDLYNANTNPSTWKASFQAQIQTHLAILDGIDGVCGNQLAAATAVTSSRYSALAGVLADDQLYVRTNSTTCGLYLAAEADAVGLTTNNGDCGGRTPLEDSIKETYSLLVIGKPTGITDGLAVGASGFGAETDGTPSISAFPFLAGPH
jgi:hypothetical protein